MVTGFTGVTDMLDTLESHEPDELDQAGLLPAGIPTELSQASAPDTLITRHVLMARLALARGERETWLRLLVELERFGQQSGSLRIQRSVWLERARVATLSKQLDVAQLALQSAQSVSEPQPPESLLPCDELDNLLIARQRLNIAQGNCNAAVEDLLEAIYIAQASSHRRREIKLQLMLAMAQDARKRTRLAMLALEQALRLAGDEGFWQGFIEEGEPLVALLRRWVNHRRGQNDQAVNPGFVAHLLQRAGIAPGHTDDPSSVGNKATPLTARETQVLRLLAIGHRNRVIAEKMFLSECTVKTHLHKINVKLGARSRTQALAIARDHGWLD
ncbi:LuxR family transcriptional regulator, maltose regulon positive regulatory protein [Pseudomonas sp. IT-P74]|uniref:LuxR C-terminal-related transcriptional regulator n=1 Tax=Pseudomonas sp. IT-P74 TaxID=3026445 RepID=UPI0039E133BC